MEFELNGTSTVCRGRQGEVGIVEFGLKRAPASHPVAPQSKRPRLTSGVQRLRHYCLGQPNDVIDDVTDDGIVAGDSPRNSQRQRFDAAGVHEREQQRTSITCSRIVFSRTSAKGAITS